MIRICGSEDGEKLLVMQRGSVSEFEIGQRRVCATVGSPPIGGVAILFEYGSGAWRASQELLLDDETESELPIPWACFVVAHGSSPCVCVDCPDDTPFALEAIEP